MTCYLCDKPDVVATIRQIHFCANCLHVVRTAKGIGYERPKPPAEFKREAA